MKTLVLALLLTTSAPAFANPFVISCVRTDDTIGETITLVEEYGDRAMKIRTVESIEQAKAMVSFTIDTSSEKTDSYDFILEFSGSTLSAVFPKGKLVGKGNWNKGGGPLPMNCLREEAL